MEDGDVGREEGRSGETHASIEESMGCRSALVASAESDMVTEWVVKKWKAKQNLQIRLRTLTETSSQLFIQCALLRSIMTMQ